MTPREHALRILARVERESLFADPLVNAVRAGAQDAAFIRTIVFGVLRWRSQLDFFIERLSERRIGKIDELVRQILRVGLYQILEMEVPSYAAVGETVNLAARTAPRARGFVNAVLRKASTADLRSILPGGDTPHDVALRTAHPEWMIRRWTSQYGAARAESIATANQQLSSPDLLVNVSRTDTRSVIDALTSRGVTVTPSPVHPDVIRLSGSTAQAAQEIQSGLVHAMDEGSAAVASLLYDVSGTILDVAAAPGGKSIALRARAKTVVSNDLSFRRMRVLRQLSARGFDDPPHTVVSDGRSLPVRSVPSILLDAPCSATGTLRKSPEIKWRLREEDLVSFAALQRSLLTEALRVAEDVCVYSTCSLEPEENDLVVGDIAAAAGFRLAALSEHAPEELRQWIESDVLRLTPESGTDGFTAVRLHRTK